MPRTRSETSGTGERSREDARTRGAADQTASSAGGCHPAELEACRSETAAAAPRVLGAGRPPTPPRGQESTRWVPQSLEARAGRPGGGCGGRRGPGGHSPPSVPRPRAGGRAAEALTYPGLGLGRGTAKFVASSGGLLPVHGSVLQLQLRLRRRLRGRKERLGPQDLRKAPHKTPFLPPAPAPPSPGPPPPPGLERGGLGMVTGPAAFSASVPGGSGESKDERSRTSFRG
nr:translation initiation factor IF-2-like [Saimiri boliviensis boliviensis]